LRDIISGGKEKELVLTIKRKKGKAVCLKKRRYWSAMKITSLILITNDEKKSMAKRKKERS